MYNKPPTLFGTQTLDEANSINHYPQEPFEKIMSS